MVPTGKRFAEGRELGTQWVREVWGGTVPETYLLRHFEANLMSRLIPAALDEFRNLRCHHDWRIWSRTGQAIANSRCYTSLVRRS